MGRLYLDGIKHVSPSQLSKLRECEQRWFNTTILKEREPGTEATAMGAGFAVALETDNVSAGILEYHASRPAPDSFTDEEADARLRVIAVETIRAAFLLYRERFVDPTTLEREATFVTRLPLHGRDEPWTMQVRLDGFLKKQYVVEDKLRSGSSLQPEKVENEVRQGEQITAEIWSVWKKTGHLVPVKLRCLRKPDQRKIKTVDTADLPEFIAEQFARDNAVEEYECVRTEDQLRAFEKRLVQQAIRVEALTPGPERIHGAAEVGGLAAGSLIDRGLLVPIVKRGAVPTRNTDACHSYGRACPFLARCQGTES